MKAPRLEDLGSDLLLRIFETVAAGGTSGGLGKLLLVCKGFNALVRHGVASSASRTVHAAREAHRALALLRPARFHRLRAVALRADTLLHVDLEQLQLPQLRRLTLENVIFESWGFNDVTHLASLTHLAVDTWAGGRGAALNEDGTLGALQALPQLSCLVLRNLASDHGLQHLHSVTDLKIEMVNHFHPLDDDTDEEAELKVDLRRFTFGAQVAAMPRLQRLTVAEGDLGLNAFLAVFLKPASAHRNGELQSVSLLSACYAVADLIKKHIAGETASLLQLFGAHPQLATLYITSEDEQHAVQCRQCRQPNPMLEAHQPTRLTRNHANIVTELVFDAQSNKVIHFWMVREDLHSG